MHRREFVAAMRTAAAVVSAGQAFAVAANAATAESMHPAKYKAPEESTAHWRRDALRTRRSPHTTAVSRSSPIERLGCCVNPGDCRVERVMLG